MVMVFVEVKKLNEREVDGKNVIKMRFRGKDLSKSCFPEKNATIAR